MSKNTIKTRVLQLYDTLENWNDSGFIPLEGEFVVYETDDFPKIKVGDGVNPVSNLEFINEDITIEEVDTICGMTIISGEEARL